MNKCIEDNYSNSFVHRYRDQGMERVKLSKQLFNEYKSGNFRDLTMSSEKTKSSFVKLAKGSKLKSL